MLVITLTNQIGGNMYQCKRIATGEYAEYHYRGYAITKANDHWNIGHVNGEVFDARQTKTECKLLIDRMIANQ